MLRNKSKCWNKLNKIQWKTSTFDTVIFGLSPWKNPTRENWCSRSKGFVLLSNKILSTTRVPISGSPFRENLGNRRNVRYTSLSNPRLIWIALVKPLSASVWCLHCYCVSLCGQAEELHHLSSANDQADLKLSFGLPGSETPASSYLRTESKRHRITFVWFPSGTASPLQGIVLSLSASLLLPSEMHSWSSWPASASTPLNLITESKSLSKPCPSDLILDQKLCLLTQTRKCQMLNVLNCVFHRPLTLLIFFRWPFNDQD